MFVHHGLEGGDRLRDFASVNVHTETGTGESLDDACCHEALALLEYCHSSAHMDCSELQHETELSESEFVLSTKLQKTSPQVANLLGVLAIVGLR